MENGHPDISEANSESTDVDPYENKYYALLRRCENVQQSNERLVHRLCRIKGILRRLRHERRFLMRRLDQHEDHYREVPLTVPLELEDELAVGNAPAVNSEAQLQHSVVASVSSSSFGLSSQSSEQDTVRINEAHQFNSRQSASPSWPPQNLPSTSSTVPTTTTTTSSNNSPTASTAGVPSTSKRKRTEKGSSKTNSKKSSYSSPAASTSSGLFLKNALAEYGQLNNDSAETTSKS